MQVTHRLRNDSSIVQLVPVYQSLSKTFVSIVPVTLLRNKQQSAIWAASTRRQLNVKWKKSLLPQAMGWFFILMACGRILRTGRNANQIYDVIPSNPVFLRVIIVWPWCSRPFSRFVPRSWRRPYSFGRSIDLYLSQLCVKRTRPGSGRSKFLSPRTSRGRFVH